MRPSDSSTWLWPSRAGSCTPSFAAHVGIELSTSPARRRRGHSARPGPGDRQRRQAWRPITRGTSPTPSRASTGRSRPTRPPPVPHQPRAGLLPDAVLELGATSSRRPWSSCRKPSSPTRQSSGPTCCTCRPDVLEHGSPRPGRPGSTRRWPSTRPTSRPCAKWRGITPPCRTSWPLKGAAAGRPVLARRHRARGGPRAARRRTRDRRQAARGPRGLQRSHHEGSAELRGPAGV